MNEDKWEKLRRYLRQEMKFTIREANEASKLPIYYGQRMAEVRVLSEALVEMDRLEALDV